MKPAPFAYHAPASVGDALALLREHPQSRPLAGGQSLVPMLALRLAQPEMVIDLNRLDGLAGIKHTGGALVIGAMTRQQEALRSPVLAQYAPLLIEALRHVGHPPTRVRGTIGGSLAHADPAAELPALAALFDATFTIAGTAGARDVPWSDFFVTYLTSCLEPGEILTGVTLALAPAATGWSFHEIARRHGDFALAGCATLVELDANGEAIAQARVALFGVDATPVRLLDDEPAFTGRRAADAAIDDIAAAAAAKLEPATDVHGSSAFRRDIARSLIASGVRTAARQAAARA